MPRTRTGWQFHILQNERTCQALESLQGSLWRAWAIMDLVSPRRVLLKKFARLEKPSVAGQWLTAPLATWNTEFGTLPLIGHERLDTDPHGRPRETTLQKDSTAGRPTIIYNYVCLPLTQTERTSHDKQPEVDTRESQPRMAGRWRQLALCKRRLTHVYKGRIMEIDYIYIDYYYYHYYCYCYYYCYLFLFFYFYMRRRRWRLWMLSTSMQQQIVTHNTMRRNIHSKGWTGEWIHLGPHLT